jgi:hypothetical protein
MDFIMVLPLTARKYGSIWVIVDWFMKSTHFIPVHTWYKAKRYAELYNECIICLHGVPNTIISDQGAQFIAHFWEQLHASLGTYLIHSSAYHLQTNGKTERVNQLLEDMLRVCVWWTTEIVGISACHWPNSLTKTDIKSLKMAPFLALYGCQCHTPLNWVELGERMTFGPDLVMEAEEIVHRIQSNLKDAKSHQEHYANKRCHPLTFAVRDHVYLHVLLMRGVKRFGIKEKIAPRYIGTFLFSRSLESWLISWSCCHPL